MDAGPAPAGPPTGREITPDARSLRGLAHPLRVRLLGLLRSEGPSTATRLAERLNLASGATSYHLRQLALYGFIVEDDSHGTARERWWRAAHETTKIPRGADPETAEATDGFLRGVGAYWAEQLNRAIDERPVRPVRWRDASIFSDYQLRLTPDEMDRFRADLRQLIAGYRMDNPEASRSAPPESVAIVVQIQAFPRPGADGAQGER